MRKKYLATMMLLSPFSVALASEAELNQRIDMLEEQLNATAEMVESSVANNTASATHVGAYGELHYSKIKDADDSIDFHRFVLFINHQFSDAISFNSELEVEHAVAGDKQVGGVELEQAFVDIKLNDDMRIRSGLFLVPVGIINETHEPPTFYGVERNPVEKNIIPTTWGEAGVGVSGLFAPGLSYDIYAHSGLKTQANEKYKVRKGRQKVGESVANNFAYTGRVKYTGVPGLELAGTVQYQSDITQGADASVDSAVLYETHVVYSKKGFGLRALYAAWAVSGDGAKAIGADKQNGWYVEPSYKFMGKYGVFARYNNYNNAAGGDAEATTQTNVGANFWPHPDVVFKVDYMTQGGAGDTKAVNLGLGYQF